MPEVFTGTRAGCRHYSTGAVDGLVLLYLTLVSSAVPGSVDYTTKALAVGDIFKQEGVAPVGDKLVMFSRFKFGSVCP